MPSVSALAPEPITRAAGEPRVIEIDPLADPRWDELVLSHPLANGYHLAAWPQVLAEAYRYRPCCLALEHGGALTGVMPVVHSGRRLSGSRLSSLPTAKSAGPLAQDHEGALALLRAAAELKHSLRVGGLNVRSAWAHLERDIENVRVASAYSSYVLALTSADELLARYKRSSKNLHRSLSKAQRSRLTIATSSSTRELRRWYRLYLRTMRKHRSFPRSLRQFEAAMALLDPERWRLITVGKDGEIIAGGVFHDIAGTVELLYNASDPAFLSSRPNHALYWHVINEAIDRGRVAFDFGSANSDALRSFKEQWGAKPVEHYAYVHDRAAPAQTMTTVAHLPGALPRDGERGHRAAPGSPTSTPTAPGSPASGSTAPGSPASVEHAGHREGPRSGPSRVRRMAIRGKDLGGEALAHAPLSASRLVGTAVHRLV